ncbi:hypothetical protein C7999DRAFT_12706 [Corynascus novoguineensis]|uniref:BHLH domain-containing protein n=1 Tax=Corynascus novoguineensis TaxID=1126955 RepID=A0AAN7CW49_9PEZI|nr:hypothetical protein C7999DRAFT_12706 [Corynascus novoguineensis]
MDHGQPWSSNRPSEAIDGLHDGMLSAGLVAQPVADSHRGSSRSDPWTAGTEPGCSPRFGELFIHTQQQTATQTCGLPSPAPTAPAASPSDWPKHDASCVTGAWPASPISPTAGEGVAVGFNNHLLYPPHTTPPLLDVGFQDWIGTHSNFNLNFNHGYSGAPPVASLANAVSPDLVCPWPSHNPITTGNDEKGVNQSKPSTSSTTAAVRARAGADGLTLRTAARRVKRPAPHPRPGESAAHQRARANHNLVEQKYRHRLHARFEALLDALPKGILGEDSIDQACDNGGTGWDDGSGISGERGIKGKNNRRMSKVDVLSKAERVIRFLEGDIERIKGEMEELRRQSETAYRTRPRTQASECGHCEWLVEGESRYPSG